MKCMVVTAHPLPASLCRTLTDRVAILLQTSGHDVVLEDLYAENFDPALTAGERKSYYSNAYNATRVAKQVDRLLAAEAIVLVFPTWWFGFPAVFKGWFDRVWGPGIAYDHASNFGPIKKIVKIALLRTCAPGCKFEMVSLYKSEDLPTHKVERFAGQIEKRLSRWV